LASDYNRDVFALPGRNTDKYSIGCNNLIKTQRAHLLTSAADILYILDWKTTIENTKPVQKQLFVDLDIDEQKVFNYLLQNGKQQIDEVALNCDLPIFKLASLLLNMELKGVVRPLQGKMFEAI
jgi:DNA processing protein